MPVTLQYLMSQGLWRLYLIVNQMRFHSLSSSSSRDKARSAECPASLTHADRLTFVTSLPFVELPVEDGLGLTHEFFRGAIVQEMLIFSNCFSFWLLQEKLSLPHPDPTPLRHWELLLFHLGTSKKKKWRQEPIGRILSSWGGFLLLLVVILSCQEFW